MCSSDLIPERPAFQAAARIKPTDRSAYYANGWHLLTRDLQGQAVMADILAFIGDPEAPLPSGAPPITTAPGGDNWTPLAEHATAGL